MVKMTPVTLPASAEVRLRRLAPGATYQAERLTVPIAPTRPPAGTPLGACSRPAAADWSPCRRGRRKGRDRRPRRPVTGARPEPRSAR